MSPTPRPSYNQRLFGSGWRGRFHHARFDWVARRARELGIPCDAVLELGCFDGRLLDHLPFAPRVYKGFDAGWEGGLDAARARFAGRAGRVFARAERAADMRLAPGESFDLAVSLETLEHVPPGEVEAYLGTIARHLDGHLLVSVPNEIGFVFVVKRLVKRFFAPGRGEYTWREFFWLALARPERVRRAEHKGFDYRALVAQVARHFEIVSVSGLPFPGMPARFSPGVAIVARTRPAGRLAPAFEADFRGGEPASLLG